MSESNSDVQVPPDGPLKPFFEYFKTLHGWLSVAPGATAVTDSFLKFLPISSAVKPWVYILVGIQILYAVWSEAARYSSSTNRSPVVEVMPGRARKYIIGAILAVGVYWVGTAALDEFPPESVVVRTSALFCLAVIFSFIFGSMTRSFVILALKLKILA